MSNLKLRHFAEMFDKSMKSSMLVSMISSSLVFGGVHPAQAMYLGPKPMHQDIIAKKQKVKMPQFTTLTLATLILDEPETPFKINFPEKTETSPCDLEETVCKESYAKDLHKKDFVSEVLSNLYNSEKSLTINDSHFE